MANITAIIAAAKKIYEFATSEDVFEIASEVWKLVRSYNADRQNADDGSILVRALHRIRDRQTPRIALAGMTSAGKSSLLNALFGHPIAEVKRTADTTDCVLRVQFASGLVVYDTPGIGGDEAFENVTRVFLGLPQDVELRQIVTIPYRSNNETDKRNLDPPMARIEAPVDIVLFVIDVSRTLTRQDRKALEAIILRLKDVYGARLVVTGTHMDELRTTSERDAMLRAYQSLANDRLVPVSTITNEGLTELVNHIFRSLPSDVSLSAMQQALVDARKSSRIAFVIAETSGIISEIVVMDGKSSDEIRVLMLLLYAIICNHYSVDEMTWLRFNGDALEIGKHIEAQGQSKKKVDRPPANFFEWFRSAFLGTKFFEIHLEYRKLGLPGLLTIVPAVCQVLSQLANVAGENVAGDNARQWINARQEKLEGLIETNSLQEISNVVAAGLAEVLGVDPT